MLKWFINSRYTYSLAIMITMPITCKRTFFLFLWQFRGQLAFLNFKLHGIFSIYRHNISFQLPALFFTPNQTLICGYISHCNNLKTNIFSLTRNQNTSIHLLYVLSNVDDPFLLPRNHNKSSVSHDKQPSWTIVSPVRLTLWFYVHGLL